MITVIRDIAWAWCGLEMFYFIVTISRREKNIGSLYVLWTTITIGVSLGFFLRKVNIGNITGTMFYVLTYVGFIILLAGATIRWGSLIQIQKYLKEGKLCQTGLYKMVRHPSYLGLIICFWGLGILMVNWITAVVLCISVTAAVRYRTYTEERFINKNYGEEYKEYYKKVTKRFIPNIY